MNKKLNDLINNKVFSNSNNYLLSKNNYANFFDVINKGENSYFNLTKNVSFKNIDYMNTDLYDEYLVKSNDCWTNISYLHYKTIELWWLICKFNNIKNPFTGLVAGTIIKVPKQEIVDYILTIIASL